MGDLDTRRFARESHELANNVTVKCRPAFMFIALPS